MTLSYAPRERPLVAPTQAGNDLFPDRRDKTSFIHGNQRLYQTRVKGTPRPNNPNSKFGMLITAKKASTAVWLEAGWALMLEGDWLAELIVGEEVLEEPDEEVDPVAPDGM
jgi:hypothetical protein